MLKEVDRQRASTSSSWAPASASRSRATATTVTVRDYGRGIPLGKVVDCVSQINTGGKYNDDVFQFSVGLNGVGTKAVNALSPRFEVTSWRDGKFRRAKLRARQAQEREEAARTATTPRRHLRPLHARSARSSARFAWNEEFIAHRLRYYAYLNAGLTLVYNGETLPEQERAGGPARPRDRRRAAALRASSTAAQDRLEFAFTHANAYGETYYSLRQRPVHERRRHPPERLPRGRAQGRERVRQARTSRARTCATASSAPSRSSSRIPSSRARPRTSSARPRCAAGSCRP